MKNKIIAALAVMSLPMAGSAQTFWTVNVSNESDGARTSAPVVIDLRDCGFNVKSAVVMLGNAETPCQIDDINGDGIADELCFLADVEGNSAVSFNVELYDSGLPCQYEPQVYVEMLLSNKKVKASNKQDLYISHLTVDHGVNPYWTLHHHGAAFENEMVAYRVYFDHRQTVDIYGKYHKGLELRQTQFYPDDTQKAEGYGDDVLWVGSTFGVGALRGWDGTQPTMVQDVQHRSQRIVARGPLRTIVEVVDEGWVPQEGQKPVSMTALYTLYAGNRDCRIDISFDKDVSGYEFSTGIINVKNSTEYTDNAGLRACWGTDWPVSEKDSAGHKRETVGLAICVPKANIVSEKPADKDNYTYVVKASADNTLSYRVMFTSDNEEFGYHSDTDWYDYVKAWKKDVEQPLVVTVNE